MAVGINYSKWDTLDVSGSEDEEGDGELSKTALIQQHRELTEASEAQLVKSSKTGSRNAVSGPQRSTSKFCGNCGSPHDGAVKFCGSCGTPVST